MWLYGLIFLIMGGLLLALGILKMVNAKKKASKANANETVTYMDTQKRKTWGLTWAIIGGMICFVGLIFLFIPGV